MNYYFRSYYCCRYKKRFGKQTSKFKDKSLFLCILFLTRILVSYLYRLIYGSTIFFSFQYAIFVHSILLVFDIPSTVFLYNCFKCFVFGAFQVKNFTCLAYFCVICDVTINLNNKFALVE